MRYPNRFYLLFFVLQFFVLIAGVVQADASALGGVSRGQLSSDSVGMGADMVANAMRKVDTVAALRSMPVPSYARSVYLVERGGGVLVWDPSGVVVATVDPQSGVYIAPDSDLTGASGAWVRQYSGPVCVDWFGAVGDGVAVDTVAIQAAVNFGDSVRLSAKSYLSGTVYLDDNTEIFGVGRSSVLVQGVISLWREGVLSVQSSADGLYIKDVVIRDLAIVGPVVALGFDENKMLISFGGVDTVTVRDCFLLGFQSDAIFLSQGQAEGQMRHNRNVRILNNYIDGINNDNRNGVSIVDGENVLIDGNSFYNTTKAGMPGAVDIEPDKTWHVVRNITVSNNYFNNCGGNGYVGLVVGTQLLDVQPENFIFSGNQFETPTTNGVFVKLSLSYPLPVNIQVINNSGHVYRPFNMTPLIDGVLIGGNNFTISQSGLLGYDSTDIVKNTVITGNSFRGDGSLTVQAIELVSADGLLIQGNQFTAMIDSAIVIGGVSATIANMAVMDNAFLSIDSPYYAVNDRGGVTDGASCRYLGNYGITELTHKFKAWVTDYTGLTTNGVTAETFNSATLPGAFSSGTSVAMIEGDTGVPDVSGYDGMLITYYQGLHYSNHYNFIYQHYYPANNGTGSGSYYIRKAHATADSWGAWFEVVGI